MDQFEPLALAAVNGWSLTEGQDRQAREIYILITIIQAPSIIVAQAENSVKCQL